MHEFIVDTNVPLIAKGDSHMSTMCEENCANFIEGFLTGKKILVIDDEYAILDEYMRCIPTTGPINFASIFLKWIYENQANVNKVKQVKINKIGEKKFEEIPSSLSNLNIDPSDLKFIAVAISNGGKAPIAEAADSKWIGWENELLKNNVKLHFNCKKELNDVFKRKIG